MSCLEKQEMNSASARPQVSIKECIKYSIKPSGIQQVSGNFAISLIFREFRLSGKQGTLPTPISFVMRFVLFLTTLQMTHLLLTQDISCFFLLSPGMLVKLMVFLKTNCNQRNIAGGKSSSSAEWFCSTYRQTDEQMNELCANLFVLFPFTVPGFGISVFRMS